MGYKKVKVVSDDSGHWYIIPNELEDLFYSDLEDEELVESGEFSEKYDQYMTGGAINNLQLYIKE